MTHVEIVGPVWLLPLLAGLFGLLIGSFLNVCIARWPAEQSVIRPRSRWWVCAWLT